MVRSVGKPVRNIEPVAGTVSTLLPGIAQVVPGHVALVPAAVDPDNIPFMRVGNHFQAVHAHGPHQQGHSLAVSGALGAAVVQARIGIGGAVVPGRQVFAVVHHPVMGHPFFFKVSRRVRQACFQPVDHLVNAGAGRLVGGQVNPIFRIVFRDLVTTPHCAATVEVEQFRAV